jgi:hypothetical protein
MPTNRIPFGILLPAIATAIAAAPATAKAQAPALASAFTVYGAYRGGGSFTDAASGASLSFESSAAGAFSLDLPLDGSRQWQLYLSHQRTELEVAPAVAPGAAASPWPLTVTYLHIGGTSFFQGPVGQGPYVVGGLGATVFAPGQSGYSNEIRPSMNLGIGYQWPLAERLALRLEARGYVTLVNSSGGLFCSGGCVLVLEGDTVTQGEVQLGLSYRF